MNTTFQPKWALPKDPISQYGAQLDESQTIGGYDPLLGLAAASGLDAMGAKRPGGAKLPLKGSFDPSQLDLSLNDPGIVPPPSPTPSLEGLQQAIGNTRAKNRPATPTPYGS